MKIYKKIAIFVLLLFVLVPNVNAKTLRDLKNELAAIKEKKSQNDSKKNLTKNEINSVNSNIEGIRNKITESENTIKKLTEDINELNENISKKELEIKEIIHFLQVSNGENAYLEYIFGSKDITDFIYRSAVSGQLVNYNDKLIDEYNDTIKKNQKKQEDLKVEMVNLGEKQKNLEAELSKLGDTLKDLNSISVDIDAEIAAQEKVVNYYEKTLQCKLDENINSCGKVPYSGKFIRPIQSGRITSNFGSRCYWNGTQGRTVCSYHYGIDIAGGDTQVYAAAPGTVANILWKQSCGGNMLFVNHNVGGNYYTTGYYHLKSINVKVGDYVDQNTVIAITGGDSSTWGYDRCSTGRHLHFAVATGLYMKDYLSWSTYQSRNINPITVVNFPGSGVWFSNRVTRY